MSEVYKFFEPGLLTDLIITKNIEIKLDEPYNKCVNNWSYTLNPKLNEQMIRSSYKNWTVYRQINCYQLCSRSSELLNGSKKIEFKDRCFAECPLECKTTYYSTKTESVIYHPSEFRFNVSKWTIGSKNDISNMSDSLLRSRLLNLYVYIEDMKYTEVRSYTIKQKPI